MVWPIHWFDHDYKSSFLRYATIVTLAGMYKDTAHVREMARIFRSECAC